MEAGVFELAKNQSTSEPLLINVLQARRLNEILNGPFFGPWDVEHIPEETLDQILAFDKVNELKPGFAEVEARFAAWRQAHG